MLRGPIHARTLIFEDIFYSMESHAARRKTLVRHAVKTNGSLRSSDPDDEETSLLPNHEWNRALEEFLPRLEIRESDPSPHPMAMLEDGASPMQIMSGSSETTLMSITPSLPSSLATINSPKTKRVHFDLKKSLSQPLTAIPEETTPGPSRKFTRLRFSPIPPLPPRLVFPESDP